VVESVLGFEADESVPCRLVLQLRTYLCNAADVATGYYRHFALQKKQKAFCRSLMRVAPTNALP